MVETKTKHKSITKKQKNKQKTNRKQIENKERKIRPKLHIQYFIIYYCIMIIDNDNSNNSNINNHYKIISEMI